MPAENDLGRRLTMVFGNVQDHIIFKAFLCMSPAAERVPGLHYDPILLHVIPKFCILIEDMILVLDHCRCDLCERKHFLNLLFCIIVGNADGMDLSALHGLFHSFINTGVIRAGLMDQHQIDIIHVKVRQGLVDHFRCPVMITAIDLAGNKDFLPCDDSFVDRAGKSLPHAGLVLIVPGGINEAHAGFQRIVCGILRFLIRKCPCACTDDGHFPATVKKDFFCGKIKFAHKRIGRRWHALVGIFRLYFLRSIL